MEKNFKDIGEVKAKITNNAYIKDGKPVNVFRQIKPTMHIESGHKFLQLSKGIVDEHGNKIFHAGFGISEEDFDFYIKNIEEFRMLVKNDETRKD